MRKTELTILLNEIGKKIDLSLFDINNSQRDTSIVLKDQNKLYFAMTNNLQGKSFDEFTYGYTNYNYSFTHKNENRVWIGLQQVIAGFEKWYHENIEPYFAEKNLPDPLEELRKQQGKIFNAINDDDSEKFTTAEKSSLSASADNLQQSILDNFELTEEVKEYVRKEISYFKDRTENLNRRDFKAVALKLIYDIGVNVVANSIVAAGQSALSTHIPPLFWTLVQRAFSFMLSSGQ